MSIGCPGIADGAFLQSVLTFVDCQAQTLGGQGYQAMAAPGSPLSLVLTGLLTLFIAFYGYRLLFGEQLGVRDGVMAALKIGIVLALATNWGAFRTLAYDVTMHGPAELASGMGSRAGLPGASGGLVARLQQADNALVALYAWDMRSPAGAGAAPSPSQLGTVRAALPEPPSIFGPFALGTARLVFLTATIAAYASVRIAAGLLLALGPLFIAFLLFGGTRGLFEGWIRGITAAILGAVAVTILLAVELALLEPWLATLLVQRQAGLPLGGAATELLVIAFAFGLALLAGLGMAARITLGFRVETAWRTVSERFATSMGSAGATQVPGASRERSIPSEQHSRAAAVAEAVARVQRQEAISTTGSPARALTLAGVREIPTGAPTPIGQRGRRTHHRVSASAARRDSSR